jgi:hypothetical protein
MRQGSLMTLLVLAGLGGVVFGADWQDALEQKLRADIACSDVSMDRLRISKPGTVLVIQKDGISGDLASDATFLKVYVRDGQISQRGGFIASMQNKQTSRIFKPGERVYVWKINVGDEQLQYYLISADTFDAAVKGSTRQTRYKTLLQFEFPKDQLNTATPETLAQTIHAVIMPEGALKAATSAPRTVELGQTPEQVEAAIGKPETVINLGTKITWVYKNITVVFVDGKVADVQ